MSEAKEDNKLSHNEQFGAIEALQALLAHERKRREDAEAKLTLYDVAKKTNMELNMACSGLIDEADKLRAELAEERERVNDLGSVNYLIRGLNKNKEYKIKFLFRESTWVVEKICETGHEIDIKELQTEVYFTRVMRDRLLEVTKEYMDAMKLVSKYKNGQIRLAELKKLIADCEAQKAKEGNV